MRATSLTPWGEPKPFPYLETSYINVAKHSYSQKKLAYHMSANPLFFRLRRAMCCVSQDSGVMVTRILRRRGGTHRRQRQQTRLSERIA